MQLRQMVSTKLKGAAANAVQRFKNNPAVQRIKRYAKLERLLACVCGVIPILFIIFDDFSIRDSISAYYSMKSNQVYYYFLTVAAMMFIVNGVIKKQRFYNTILGIMLTGVILFNHVDAEWVHKVFAVAFFAGNALVMLFYSSMVTRKIKLYLVVVMAISLLAWWLHLITIFWAEWISLVMITIHYMQDISLRKVFLKK